jgi:thiosulfate reductase cytochrome b subunit
MAASTTLLRETVSQKTRQAPRHSAVVRITHWLTTVCVVALLVSGFEIVISHPRFYWGETGNPNTPSLFDIPIPASRPWVNTGYNFVLPDQNGWSRNLHFETAWILTITGLVYAISGIRQRHFRRNLLPAAADLSWSVVSRHIANHLRFRRPPGSEAASYNVLQRLTYLAVIFVMLPVAIGTGLAMSPAIASVFPSLVKIWGGVQSARTLHFVASLLTVLFLVIHIVMVCRAGFMNRTRAMVTGRATQESEIR